MGGGEGDVPSSSDGLPNVGNGVADILVEFHCLSVLVGVSAIVTAKTEPHSWFVSFSHVPNICRLSQNKRSNFSYHRAQLPLLEESALTRHCSNSVVFHFYEDCLKFSLFVVICPCCNVAYKA